MKPVTLRWPAKLNLFLEVLGKRPDGYHELSTVMAPVALYDTLTLTPAKTVHARGGRSAPSGDEHGGKGLERGGPPQEDPGRPGQADQRRARGQRHGRGSSDAAAMIEGLDRLFDLGWTGTKWRRRSAATSISSSSAAPALHRPRRKGRADRLRPELHAVILWPGFP